MFDNIINSVFGQYVGIYPEYEIVVIVLVIFAVCKMLVVIGEILFDVARGK